MKDRIKKIILDRIGNHRGAHTEFAFRVGVRTGLVGDWLSGKANPGAEYRKKICNTFNISRDWLDTGEGNMMEKPPEGAVQTATVMTEREVGRLEGELTAMKNQVERYEKRLDRYDNEIYTILKKCADGLGIKKSVAVADIH